MPRKSRTTTIIVNAAIFILLEVAALVMLSNRGPLQSIWIARAGHSFMAKVWGGSDKVRYYFSLKDANEAIADENLKLRTELEGYKALGREQAAAGRVVDNLPGSDFTFSPASIVKISRNKAHNYFILDKGTDDGIRPQSGVITANGVVGLIDAVDKHYSFGLLMLNSDISVSSRIGHEGATGRLSWDGRSQRRAILSDIPLQFKFNPGDTVWTSGFSAIFPPDIPLGIIRDSRIVGGAVNEIGVELLQDFSSLRYVTVVENLGREEITYLENLDTAPQQ